MREWPPIGTAKTLQRVCACRSTPLLYTKTPDWSFPPPQMRICVRASCASRNGIRAESVGLELEQTDGADACKCGICLTPLRMCISVVCVYGTWPAVQSIVHAHNAKQSFCFALLVVVLSLTGPSRSSKHQHRITSSSHLRSRWRSSVRISKPPPDRCALYLRILCIYAFSCWPVSISYRKYHEYYTFCVTWCISNALFDPYVISMPAHTFNKTEL